MKYEALTDRQREEYRDAAKELLAPDSVLARVLNDIRLNSTDVMATQPQESREFAEALSVLRGIGQIEGALRNVDTDHFRKKGFFRRMARKGVDTSAGAG